MIGYKLDRRDEAVTVEEFERSRQVMRAVGVVWASLLVVGIMMASALEWYYFAIMLGIFALLMPSPGEIFQSYDHYKKTWLRHDHGGAMRGERASKLHG